MAKRRGWLRCRYNICSKGRQVGGNAILSSRSRGRGSNTRAGWWVRVRCPRGCYPLSSPSTHTPPTIPSRLPSSVAWFSTEFPGVDCASSREACLNFRETRGIVYDLFLFAPWFTLDSIRLDSEQSSAESRSIETRWFSWFDGIEHFGDFRYSDLWKRLWYKVSLNSCKRFLFVTLMSRVGWVIWSVEMFG